jgi:hypothetical protein
VKANPLLSAGARLERAAFRNRLRRMIEKWARSECNRREEATLVFELKWIEGRQKRYDKRPGGLGK